MDDSYEWILVGVLVSVVTVTGYGLWVRFHKWRQGHRTLRLRKREFL